MKSTLFEQKSRLFLLWLSALVVQILIVFTNIVTITKTERRIVDGMSTQKDYVVYLVKKAESPQKYNNWICGGTIVTASFIITSAACVEDVQHMYAIAGYQGYVASENLEYNVCTKRLKKKIVYICVPKTYELDYERVERWSFVDIAAVKVESPYNFSDVGYLRFCSYLPRAISVNYEAKYQEPGKDAMVLGWGHSMEWRKPGDNKDYNQVLLHYATTIVHDKDECKKFFTSYKALMQVIDQFMICTLEDGNVNDMGRPFTKIESFIDGCTPHGDLRNGQFACEEEGVVLTRKSFNKILQRQQLRRNGICQNDHGGPLVTWVGGKEILIGVASVFRVTNESTCTGPYLYTSTYCNGAFIDCVLKTDKATRRRTVCEQPPNKKGFDTIERIISWEDHPEEPAEMKRPTVPNDDENQQLSASADNKPVPQLSDEYEDWEK